MEITYKLIFICSLSAFVGVTYGYGRFRFQIPNGFNVSHPCGNGIPWDAVGHAEPHYVPRKNLFGQDVRRMVAGRAPFDWKKVCNQDSDGDGLTNGQELGDPSCTWEPGRTPSGNVIGHPGFCEPNRQQCRSGGSHPQCPSRFDTNKAGSGLSPKKQPPPGSNHHPQISWKTGGITSHVRPGLPIPGSQMTRPNFGARPQVPQQPSMGTWQQPRMPQQAIGGSIFGDQPQISQQRFRGAPQFQPSPQQPGVPSWGQVRMPQQSMGQQGMGQQGMPMGGGGAGGFQTFRTQSPFQGFRGQRITPRGGMGGFPGMPMGGQGPVPWQMGGGQFQPGF